MINKYTINFYLEIRKGKTENLPINLDVSYSSGKMRYYIGYRCDKDKWAKEVTNEDGEIEKVQRVKKNTINRDGVSAAIINARIIDLTANVNLIFKEFGNNIPSYNQLRNELKKHLGEKPKTKESDFYDYYEQYIANTEVGEARKEQLRSTMNHFKRYCIDKNITITFEKCTTPLLDDFKKYLTVQKAEIKTNKGKLIKDQGRSKNTISAIMGKLKAFFTYAKKMHWIERSPFEEYKIEREVYGDPIYLTKEERDYLYNKDIENPKLAMIRDIFILQCFLGLRVNDFTKLRKAHIINGVIEFIHSKTRDESQKVSRIPLSEKAKNIIAKYDLPDGRLVPNISDQRYNTNLKELFEHVGLKRSVVRLNPKTRQNEIVPLYQIASSHMARRTFIGLLHKTVKNEIIASMSGHVENSKAFRRYYKIDNDDLKNAIKNIE